MPAQTGLEQEEQGKETAMPDTANSQAAESAEEDNDDDAL